MPRCLPAPAPTTPWAATPRSTPMPLGSVGAIKVEASPWVEDNLWVLEVAQKDPIIVYKKEAFKFFGMMMEQITGDCVRKLFAVQIAPSETANRR